MEGVRIQMDFSVPSYLNIMGFGRIKRMWSFIYSGFSLADK
jgi:hypothetical protein